jgi:hypothetical protein
MALKRMCLPGVLSLKIGDIMAMLSVCGPTQTADFSTPLRYGQDDKIFETGQ